MLIFFIFSLWFLPALGNEDTVECDLYNQRYPNLTLTKVYSEKTTTICKDKCITYLCAVNFRDPDNNERVYAMGSGCIEDVRDNCEFYIDFANSAHWYPGPQAIASICVNITGEKICDGTFDACLDYYVSRFPNDPLGWDHYYNISYEPDVDGVRSFNESLNTIYPVRTITTTTPIPDSTTTTTVPVTTTMTTTSQEPDPTTTTTSTTTTTTLATTTTPNPNNSTIPDTTTSSIPDTTTTPPTSPSTTNTEPGNTTTTTVPETTTSQEPDTTTHVPNPDTSTTSTSQVPDTTPAATPTTTTTTTLIPDTTTTSTTTPSPDTTSNPSPDTLPPCRNGGQSSNNIYAIAPVLIFIIFDF